MVDSPFFDAPTNASGKKHRIVSKYTAAWGNIVLPQARAHEGKIRYVDLYCGPGRYKDGTPSTPVLMVELAIKSPALCASLQTVFNDEDPDFVTTLQEEISKLPGIERLKHRPIFRNRKVGRDIIPRIAAIDVPTLFFADPWGYQGISIDLIGAALTHWGSDFLFFFNYNRINMNLSSDAMNGAIDEFFSPACAEQLRRNVAQLRPAEREKAILKAMRDAVDALGAQAEIFTYRSKTGARTTHHLMCVSKHKQGVALFKEISAKESTRFDDNVPSLDHNPGTSPAPGLLFSPMRVLEAELLSTFAGKELTTDQIYHAHHNGKPYILTNYRQALLHLEELGAIEIIPSRIARRLPNTLPADARVRFPQAG